MVACPLRSAGRSQTGASLQLRAQAQSLFFLFSEVFGLEE